MILILVMVLVYAWFAGTEALTGAEEEPASVEAARYAPVRAETRPGLMRLGRKVLHHSLNVYAGSCSST